MQIIIEPPDPTWPTQFETIKTRLTKILSSVPYTSIEHVGSTSVPFLPAKPVLDIDIIIRLTSLSSARAALVTAGYYDCGEMGIPGRYQFREPGFGLHEPACGQRKADGSMRMNTYVMIEGSTSLKNHLDVKRVLMEDEELRAEYARVKWGLVGREFASMDEYGKGKVGVLRRILRRAGWGEDELPPGKDQSG